MGLKVNDVNLSTIIDQLARLWYSSYLRAALIAYLVGQLIKIVLLYRRNPHLTFRDFFASGNMPSTHTASTCAVTTVVGLSVGFDSAIFAVAMMLTLIVGYDAAHVRRAVGEHGLVLRELIDRDSQQEKLLATLSKELEERGDRKFRRSGKKLAKPYFSRGHLPKEVMAGAILGVAVGIIVWLI